MEASKPGMNIRKALSLPAARMREVWKERVGAETKALLAMMERENIVAKNVVISTWLGAAETGKTALAKGSMKPFTVFASVSRIARCN